MTREEAIDLLDNLIGMVEDNHQSDYDTALQMAIKALEQEPCGNAVSRQDVLDLAKKGVLISNGNYESVCKAINELPSVNPQEPKTDSWSIKDVVDTFKKHGLIREQEPCEDAISRAEAVRVASGYCHPANVAKELEKLPSVNPQTCGDAIDRKLVCAFIDGLISDDGEREKGLEYIRNMPPVNPQPCEDAISRQAALGCCRNEWEEEVEMRLKSLPSVNPTKNVVNNGTMNITL